MKSRRSLPDSDDPALTLTQSLHHLLRGFIGDDDPTAAGQSSESARVAEDGVRLYLREMIEPTPVFAAAAAQHIGPVHDAIARLLARHIGVQQPDEDVHRLVFGLIAMAHDYCMSREFMQALAPRLLEGADALQRARERLVDWGVALVDARAAQARSGERMKHTTRRRWLPLLAGLLAPVLLAACATPRLPSTPSETAPERWRSDAAARWRQRRARRLVAALR